MTRSWNEFLKELPNPHILQTSEWAEQKKDIGWVAEPLMLSSDNGTPMAGALVLTRTFRPLGFGKGLSICYVPRGPIVDWNDTELVTRVFSEIEQFCRRKKAIFIKVDPEIGLGTGVPGSTDESTNPVGLGVQEILKSRKWQFSKEQVQFRNTVLIDISGSEETWLARMKQKTRYNIRLAQRSGVVVRQASVEELSLLYKMYAQTAARDNFIIREEGYYMRLWQQFLNSGFATPLVAEFENEIVAGMVMFHFGRKAWYFYGMSTNKNREKMPNYLLQWEAMKTAKSLGCELYDLWGAPDDFNGNDSMSGVFKFKEGLGGVLHRTIGAWDYPNRKIWYSIYQQLLPRVLEFTRRLRRGKIRQEAQ